MYFRALLTYKLNPGLYLWGGGQVQSRFAETRFAETLTLTRNPNSNL